MKKFTELIKAYDDFMAIGAANEYKIDEAERELGLKFSEEYKAFLREYGTASANGHEFFGICDSKRLNIVEMTLNAWKENSNVPRDLYLIEDVGIDKIYTWQNKEGQLFQTIANGIPEKIQNTLCEYVAI